MLAGRTVVLVAAGFRSGSSVPSCSLGFSLDVELGGSAETARLNSIGRFAYVSGYFCAKTLAFHSAYSSHAGKEGAEISRVRCAISISRLVIHRAPNPDHGDGSAHEMPRRT